MLTKEDLKAIELIVKKQISGTDTDNPNSKLYIENADKLEMLLADIEIMKLAIKKNSEDIQELRKKQA